MRSLLKIYNFKLLLLFNSIHSKIFHKFLIQTILFNISLLKLSGNLNFYFINHNQFFNN